MQWMAVVGGDPSIYSPKTSPSYFIFGVMAAMLMYTSLLAPIMGRYSFRKSHHVSAAFICQQETIMGAQTHIVLALSVNYDPWDIRQPMGRQSADHHSGI